MADESTPPSLQVRAEALRSAAAVGWDAAVASMRYEDGTPVEIVAMTNPYREVPGATERLPRDPEWEHLSALRADHLDAARDRIIEEAENVAHLDGTGTIGRLLALLYAIEAREVPS